MFGSKIKIPKELLAKCKDASEKLGCSSVEEFIMSVLEKESDNIINEETNTQDSAKDYEAIKNKLQGLGYID